MMDASGHSLDGASGNGLDLIGGKKSSVKVGLLALAKRFWPELETMDGQDRTSGLFDVVGFLYSAPLVLAGLVWLIAATDLALIRAELPMLALLFILQLLFERLDFFLFVEVTPGSLSSWQSSLGPVVIWSAALILGPSALWLFVIWWLTWFVRSWQPAPSMRSRWHCIRNLSFNLACVTFASLIALTLYEYWASSSTPDSVFPLLELAVGTVIPALFATFVWWLLSTLIWLPLFVYSASSRGLRGRSLKMYVRFWAITTGSHFLVDPFAVLAAGLYTQNGFGVYLSLLAGLLLASFVAHQLSQAVERSQQRSRELEELEQLGRAMLTCCPDAANLSEVLRVHVPRMFPQSQIEIRTDRGPLFGEKALLHHPHEWPPVAVSAWEWLGTTHGAHVFLPGEHLPWQVSPQPVKDALVMAPILEVDSARPLGGIYLSRNRDLGAVRNSMPAVQSLAAMIASALNSAQVYTETLAHQRIEQELALAWQIQASFLPEDLPHIPGWQLTATLKPARETSGDFYDVIPLSKGRFGIVIADVAGKGVGAALYMALSRTLIRTYATDYDSRPDKVLGATNRRILMDARATLFVTVFYGILDPAVGTLTYSNAGHPPPYLLSKGEGDVAQALHGTGMALGMVEKAAWENQVVQFAPDRALLLHTDGVVDAQNQHKEFFGRERMLASAQAGADSQARRGICAQGIQDAVMTGVHEFVGDAPQFDDITLMVVVRNSERSL
jgi:serine phosphatase RsbU (regulator of sigma subunit)